VSTGQVIDAGTLAAFLGVNTHLNYSGTAYQNVPAVINALNFLGVHRLRDVAGQTFTSAYDAVARQGFQFDFIAPGGQQQLDVGDLVGRLSSFAAAHPGAIASIEGPNEINIAPVAHAGQMGFAGGVAYQQALYSAAKADPQLAPIPVIAVSLGTGDPATFAQLGDISSVVDQGNAHIYTPFGRQPAAEFSRLVGLAQSVAPGRAVAVTETGYTSDQNSSAGVDEWIQAKLVTNLVLDAARSGVASAYLYELVDNPLSSGAGGGSFGLFHSDWSPKYAAYAVHNLLQEIAHPSGILSPLAGPPDYTLLGLPAQGSSLSFREPDGTYTIAVWAEPNIWNAGARSEVAVADQDVTVALAQPVANYAVYDPLKGTVIQTGGPTGAIHIPVSDHPVLVELHGLGFLGSAGPDVIQGWEGTANGIRGGAGDDRLTGGNDFNDVNGELGNDTLIGRSVLGDLLMGGQGNDSIDASQSTGRNQLNGNLGNDALVGGAGGDTLRGGQGDDVIAGGGGDDFLSGDLGRNTLTGGPGADGFHASAGGLEVITDFSGRAGDRILIDSGIGYQLGQQGADLHIFLSGPAGGEVVLQNVQQSAFQPGWILQF
jgi:Ca2+-binding RTX toxin-like protein